MTANMGIATRLMLLAPLSLGLLASLVKAADVNCTHKSQNSINFTNTSSANIFDHGYHLSSCLEEEKEEEDYYPLPGSCKQGRFFGQKILQPLEIPCPAVHNRVLISFQFLRPTEFARAYTNEGATVSIAVSQNGTNATSGIALDFLYSLDDMDWKDDEFVCSLVERPGIGRPYRRYGGCSADLSSPDSKLCRAGNVRHDSGRKGNILVALWNTGTCQDTILVEGFLEDFHPDSNDGTSTCVEGLKLEEERCSITPLSTVDTEENVFEIIAKDMVPSDDNIGVTNCTIRRDPFSGYSYMTTYSLDVPCPANYTVLSFDYRFQTDEWPTNTQFVSRGAYGANFEKTDGIRLGGGDTATSETCGPGCPFRLDNIWFSDGWGQANWGYGFAVGRDITFFVYIWNDGGCSPQEDTIRVEASFTENEELKQGQCSRGLSIEERCLDQEQEEAPGDSKKCDPEPLTDTEFPTAVPVFEATADDDDDNNNNDDDDNGIGPNPIYDPNAPENPCGSEGLAELGDGVCTLVKDNWVTYGTNLLRMPPAIEVPCPAVGERVLVKLSLRTPFPITQVEQNGVILRTTVAASHGPAFDETQGIVLSHIGLHSGDVACLVPMPEVEDDRYSGLCSTPLRDDSKLCDAFATGTFANYAEEFYVGVWNVGGCNSTLKIEASIEDLECYENPTVCLTPFVVHKCEDLDIDSSNDGYVVDIDPEEPAPQQTPTETSGSNVLTRTLAMGEALSMAMAFLFR